MSSLTDDLPFLLTESGVKELRKAAHRCVYTNKDGRRFPITDPTVRVVDHHAWGWSDWFITADHYVAADAALRWKQFDQLTGMISLARITVIDPRKLAIDSKGRARNASSLVPRGKRERRRASLGASIGALPGAGVGSIAVIGDPSPAGIAVGAAAALAIAASGGVVAVGYDRGKGSRSAWITDEPVLRRPLLPLMPRARRAAQEEPAMPLDVYRAIARAVFTWYDTRELLGSVPDLAGIHLGIHECMYAMLAAAPSWVSTDLTRAVDDLHRYCDLVDEHEKTLEQMQARIERERQLAEPPPAAPINTAIPLDDVESALEMYEQRLEAFRDLQRSDPHVVDDDSE